VAVVIPLKLVYTPVDATGTGTSRGNLARTPDVAVVIPLKLVYTPVDATVTAIRNYQVPSTKPKGAVSRLTSSNSGTRLNGGCC